MTGIADVPVILQNIATNERLAVYTAGDGSYSFINVPDGDYRIVEAYGTPAIPSPGDFSNAAAGAVPSAVFPPISFVNNPPPGATDLDCTTPNTILVTVSGSDLTNLYILNGPVRYVPIEATTDSCAVISPDNLLRDADEGTMGFFPPGTPANTGVPVEPYPANVPDFLYVLPDPSIYVPDDGEYTVQNIMNNSASNVLGAWWRIADHTTGNETGRMMVVNGDEPGSTFFTEQVTVEPHTNYLFSVWILNMFKALGWADPALGVEILDQNGEILYYTTLGASIPVNSNEPEWKQIGTVIYSFDNTSLTVSFVSEGPAAIGNDYAIDDVALQEIEMPIFQPHKTVSARSISIGETATYTVTLTNSCASPLTEVNFRDLIPEGLAFVPDSVTVNGSPLPGADPAIGFTVPDITGGNTAVITFQVTAEFIPPGNPTENVADMSYLYTPVEDGIAGLFNVSSNPATLRINLPWCPLLTVAFQRERNLEEAISDNSILPFDGPLVSSDNIQYQADGTIDIISRGIYIVFWFVAGMTGFASEGQLYQLKKFDYDADVPDWMLLAGETDHIKVSANAGFSIIDVSAEEILDHGRATIALFNSADAGIKLTFFHPKAGILIYGADFSCLDNQFFNINNDLADMNEGVNVIERFLYLSDVTEIWSLTPELAGLGAAVIFIGYNYNFWGIGELESQQTLNSGETYYLITSSQYPPLAFYQGSSTIGTLWLEAPLAVANKFPIHFDGSGIYFIPDSPMILPAGTKFSFTQQLILVDPAGI
jgi:uncharacterized repeat protein (TIGR01451 family)